MAGMAISRLAVEIAVTLGASVAVERGIEQDYR